MMNKLLRFTKMHGLGNDFIILNALNETLDVTQLPLVNLADRHLGIGCDQILLIEPSERADFSVRIFNADGSEAEQCGNGLRCVARFLHEEGLANSSFRIETKAGVFPVVIKNYEQIRISLHSPQVREALISLTFSQPDECIDVSILSIGNPHAVTKVEAIEEVVPSRLGPKISSHAYFPRGANVGFMQIINRQHIRLRTFERGTGETLACGSNSCAAVVAGILNGWLDHQVTVQYKLGNLLIEWAGKESPIHMTGPASRVFKGEWFLA